MQNMVQGRHGRQVATRGVIPAMALLSAAAGRSLKTKY